jgi:ribosomal protein L29
VYPLFLNLDSIKRELYENRLQDAFGGSSKIRISTIRKMIDNNLNKLRKEKKQKQARENNDDSKSMISPLLESKLGYYYEKVRNVNGAEIIDDIYISNFILNINLINFFFCTLGQSPL